MTLAREHTVGRQVATGDQDGADSAARALYLCDANADASHGLQGRVQTLEENEGHDKGICRHDHDAVQLNVDLLGPAVEEAICILAPRNLLVGEEAGEDPANHPAHAVNTKRIQRVVKPHSLLDLNRKIAQGASQQAHEEGAGLIHVSTPCPLPMRFSD